MSISFTVSISRSSMSTCFFWLKTKWSRSPVDGTIEFFVLPLCHVVNEHCIEDRRPCPQDNFVTAEEVVLTPEDRMTNQDKAWAKNQPDCDVTELARLEKEVKIS